MKASLSPNWPASTPQEYGYSRREMLTDVAIALVLVALAALAVNWLLPVRMV